MKTAVIIPTFNRVDLLRSILHDFRSQSCPADLIVVVDDGSHDGTEDMLNDEFPEVVRIGGVGDWWWTGSVNRGIEFVINNHPEIDGLVLQNDDTHIKENWLGDLISLAAQYPKTLIGCAAVDIDSPDTIAYAGKQVNTWFGANKWPYKGKKVSSVSRDLLIESFDLIGRGIYIPVSVFHQLGLYDEKHFKHRGDTELPLRARMAGYKLVVSFRPLVYIRPEETAALDVKSKYTFKDFAACCFDFRGSRYWKYKYFYGRIFARNIVQLWCYFLSAMFIMVAGAARNMFKRADK